MKAILSHWVNTNWVILTNASSLVSTTAISSILGFFYWWLAARQFPVEAVGLASAAISAMMLLGNASVMGLGTLLIGELPRRPDKAPSLITTALVVAGTAGCILGWLYALLSPYLSSDLQPLAESWGSSLLFAAGVSLTAITLVLDQALIGLLRGGLQLGRNVLFAAAKLVILGAAGIWMAGSLGLTIYATWAMGNFLSLAFLGVLIWRKRVHFSHYRPEWSLLRRLGKTALGHHTLNLVLQGPNLILPILVTIQLSAATNAHFYVAWMIATLVFTVPVALTTVLYAVGAAEPEMLAHKIRQTLGLSLVGALLANAVLWVGGHLILNLFGAVYAEEADWSLRILALGVFPLIIRHHYVAIARVKGQITNTALFMAAGGALELIMAAVGASLGGLAGLSLGWVIAVCVEAAFMAQTVYRVAFPDGPQNKTEQVKKFYVRSLEQRQQ